MKVVAKPSKTYLVFPTLSLSMLKINLEIHVVTEKRNCARSVKRADAIVGDGIFCALSPIPRSVLCNVQSHPLHPHPTSTSNESGRLSVFPSIDKASFLPSITFHPLTALPSP